MKLAILALALAPYAVVHVGSAPASADHPASHIGARGRLGAVRVVVNDPISHRPVRQAEVKITPHAPNRAVWSGFTDDQGSFDAGVLPAGGYLVEVHTFLDRAHTTFELMPNSRNVVHLEVLSNLDP
jgi:hypothetical protein